MLKVIALVVGFAGMQFLPVVSFDVSMADPPAPNAQGQARDSVSAPALRIARVIEVTDGTTEYMQPIWSPDGTKLAFTGPGFTGIYVRNADGSGPIRGLTEAEYSGYKPVWTSDSKGIVIRRRTGIVGQDISYIDIETGQVKVLAHGMHPQQPEKDAYGDVTIDVGGQTKVFDTATNSLKPVDGQHTGERPALPDVRLEIDFRQERMWVVEDDGARRTEFPYGILLASLSPTRDRVAFVQQDGDLYVSRLDGSSIVGLGNSALWDWSPDGKQLAYLSDYRESEFEVLADEIFIANADGSAVTQLTHTPDTVERFPTWSPDGMKIAYSTARAGKICVAVLEEVK